MKLPFTFGVKFVFRIVLPGFVLALGLLPIIRTVLDLSGNLIPLDYAFIISVFLFGWLIVVLDMPIYMAFEGRRYWPQFLRDICRDREQARLKRLRETIDNEKTRDNRKYREASVEIRRFPLDQNGQWEARYPTRLGNLLTAYEEYSKEIYGMYQGFYWPRIWLTLDKDLQEEIDSRQAIADSTLYTVFALYLSSILCVLYAVLHLLGVTRISYLPRAPYYWLFPVLTLVAGFLIYRLTLHVHAQFGETFKAVFDHHGPKVMFPEVLDAIAELTDTSIRTASIEQQNMVVWRYLHNYRVKCPSCSKALSVKEMSRHKCGAESELPVSSQQSQTVLPPAAQGSVSVPSSAPIVESAPVQPNPIDGVEVAKRTAAVDADPHLADSDAEPGKGSE